MGLAQRVDNIEGDLRGLRGLLGQIAERLGVDPWEGAERLPALGVQDAVADQWPDWNEDPEYTPLAEVPDVEQPDAEPLPPFPRPFDVPVPVKPYATTVVQPTEEDRDAVELDPISVQTPVNPQSGQSADGWAIANYPDRIAQDYQRHLRLFRAVPDQPFKA